MEARKFLAEVFRGCSQGYLTLWESEKRRSKHISLENPGWEGIAEQAAELWVNELSNVYLGIGLRVGGLPESRRGRTGDICALPGFGLDLDLRKDWKEEKPGEGSTAALPSKPEEVLTLLESFPLPPTLIVYSGHGFHVWWLFDSPWEYRLSSEREQVKKFLRSFQNRFLEFAQKNFGWEFDKNSSAEKVLRLPGTLNFKVPGEPKKVFWVNDEEVGPRYKLKDLRNEFELPVGRPRPIEEPVDTLVPAEDFSTVEDVLARLKAKLLSVKAKKYQDMCRSLVEGKPFAQPGKRDTTLQVLVGIVTSMEPFVAPEKLAELFRPSVAEMELAASDSFHGESPTMENVLDKICRALPSAQEKYRQKDVVRNALIKKNFPDRDGKYTDEELTEWAKASKCSLAEFKRCRWIIQKNTSFWLFKAGTYVGPVLETALLAGVPQILTPAPTVSFDKINGNGKLVRKDAKDYKEEYTTVCAGKVITSLIRQKSFYDASKDVFYEASCPLRSDLSPEFYPDIDLWLRSMGGANADTLLDWIATITFLDEQTSALFISGYPGSGKSLLAQGLAKLWTHGAPTELFDIVGGFNASLSKCPLVYSDEGLPDRKDIMEFLRRFVSNSNRDFTRKFHDTGDLEGNPRLIVAANNDQTIFRAQDTLTNEDMEAISLRFLHISVDHHTTELLKKFNKKDWVRENAIARHALWLKENRPVVRGSRFLVEGHKTNLHRLIVAKGSFPSMVCEWLVKFLSDQRKSDAVMRIKASSAVLIEKGALFVQVAAISENWDVYIKSTARMPPAGKIATALRNISKVQGEKEFLVRKRVGDKRPYFYEIDLTFLQAWIEENGIGDWDDISETISGEVIYASEGENEKWN